MLEAIDASFTDALARRKMMAYEKFCLSLPLSLEVWSEKLQFYLQLSRLPDKLKYSVCDALISHSTENGRKKKVAQRRPHVLMEWNIEFLGDAIFRSFIDLIN